MRRFFGVMFIIWGIAIIPANVYQVQGGYFEESGYMVPGMVISGLFCLSLLLSLIHI